MYAVEYSIWHVDADSRWKNTVECWYASSLREAEVKAAHLNWNKNVVEDSIIIRLMTDYESKAYYGT